jgi:hypothetical protein
MQTIYIIFGKLYNVEAQAIFQYPFGVITVWK